MWTLIRKELRGLFPFISLVLLIAATNLLDECFTEIPSQRPLSAIHRDSAETSMPGSLMILIFSLALTYGLLVRERDDGTQEFLDALPVSRTRVFVAKGIAIAAVLSLIVITDLGLQLFLQALSRTSLDPGLHVDYLASRALLDLIQLCVYTSLGLALSFFRRFGWLVAGVLVWMYLLMRHLLPELEVLNVLALGENNVSGQRLVIPWMLVVVQGSLSCGLLLLSYLLYLGVGDRMLRWLQNLDHSRWGSAVLLAGTCGIVAVFGCLLIFAIVSEPDDRPTPGEVSVTYPSWSTSRSSTKFYRFVYPANLSRPIRSLVDEADVVHERVRGFLRAPAGSPIEVDATGWMPSHLAGFAKWDKIRLDSDSLSNTAKVKAVLGHETTHVLLERLADSRLADKFNSARFFHEGVASYAEYEFFETEKPAGIYYGVAATMHARKMVDFDELVDDSRFSSKYDLELAYPLGMVFVESLIERYGQESVGRLAIAVARDDAPETLEGIELWQDTFQSCGYNLDDAVDAFFARLDREVEGRRSWIDAIPRPRAILEKEDEFVKLKVDLPESSDWKPICRFRQSANAPQLEYVEGIFDDDGICHVYSGLFPSGVVWYQVGVADSNGHVIYEPWRSSVPRR